MGRMCTRCGSLAINRAIITDIRAQLDNSTDREGNNRSMIHVLSDMFHPTLQALQSSAEARCHLCTLLLWTWEQAHPSRIIDISNIVAHNKPLELILRIRKSEVALSLIWDWKEGLPLQLELEDDDMCRGAEVSNNASSSDVVSTIKGWMRDCNNSHERCPHNQQSWLPTRVVDVGGSSDPRLCDGSGNTGKYITLSHRWNELTSASSTTRSNFEARKLGIDFQTLSSTFQDIIHFCREVGVRYLWIDSLCIVQDSPEDWDRESRNMMAIYECAWLNIAAAGSDGLDGRLFMRRTPSLTRPCRLQNFVISDGSEIGSPAYAYLDTKIFAHDTILGFLDERGWVMQERQLSARTVFFGKDEVFWECAQHMASESQPWGFNDPKIPITKLHSQARILKPDGFDFESSYREIYKRSYDVPLALPPLDSPQSKLTYSPLFPVFDYWYTCLESYTSKRLTKQSDILLAIEGLAEALHKSRMPGKSIDQCYRYGLWIEDISHGLLWQQATNKGVVIFGMPSYSWCSYSSKVKYPASTIGVTHNYTKPKPGSQESGPRSLPMFLSPRMHSSALTFRGYMLTAILKTSSAGTAIYQPCNTLVVQPHNVLQNCVITLDTFRPHVPGDSPRVTCIEDMVQRDVHLVNFALIDEHYFQAIGLLLERDEADAKRQRISYRGSDAEAIVYKYHRIGIYSATFSPAEQTAFSPQVFDLI